MANDLILQNGGPKLRKKEGTQLLNSSSFYKLMNIVSETRSVIVDFSEYI